MGLVKPPSCSFACTHCQSGVSPVQANNTERCPKASIGFSHLSVVFVPAATVTVGRTETDIHTRVEENLTSVQSKYSVLVNAKFAEILSCVMCSDVM